MFLGNGEMVGKAFPAAVSVDAEQSTQEQQIRAMVLHRLL